MNKANPNSGITEGQISLILMKAGVTGPEIDECLTWAFGSNALYVPIYPDWIDRWRKLHPQFTVDKSMPAVDWLYVVGTLFLTWKRRNTKNDLTLN